MFTKRWDRGDVPRKTNSAASELFLALLRTCSIVNLTYSKLDHPELGRNYLVALQNMLKLLGHYQTPMKSLADATEEARQLISNLGRVVTPTSPTLETHLRI